MSAPTCESCGQPLLFVENVASGRRMPLVREPNRVAVTGLKSGMVVVSPSREKGKVLTLSDIADLPESLVQAVEDGRVHTTHFGDCKDAKSWVGKTRAQRREEGLF